MKRWKRVYPQEKGFTLVEVLASTVIISIVLIGVLNLIIFSNETASINNDRLVAIHLGKASLERVKMDPFSYIERPSNDPTPEYINGEKEYNKEVCESLGFSACNFYHPVINNQPYEITITASQQKKEQVDENKLRLINVLVTVKDENNKVQHQVEGYVNYGY